MIMKNLITLFACLFSFSLLAQLDTIYFDNPSFEGKAKEGSYLEALMPKYWIDCGFRGETAPDIHPVLGGNFTVSKTPADGNTYLGMVVRDNETWERIGQKLPKKIKAGKCYKFSVVLARSETYFSQSRVTAKAANYVTPCALQVYGGSEYCQRNELLATSTLVRNTGWLEYELSFEASENHNYIMLEAFYKKPVLFPYNGNILVDDLSPIFEIDCNTYDSLSLVKTKEHQRTEPFEYSAIHKNINPNNSKTTNLANKNQESQTTYSASNTKYLNRKKRIVSESIPLQKSLCENGLFEKEERETKEEGVRLLKEIAAVVKSDPYLKLVIGLENGESRSMAGWRKRHLKKLLRWFGLKSMQFEVDKISKIKETEWTARNEFFSIKIGNR